VNNLELSHIFTRKLLIDDIIMFFLFSFRFKVLFYLAEWCPFSIERPWSFQQARLPDQPGSITVDPNIELFRSGDRKNTDQVPEIIGHQTWVSCVQSKWK
jgi:hypothetical protein